MQLGYLPALSPNADLSYTQAISYTSRHALSPLDHIGPFEGLLLLSGDSVLTLQYLSLLFVMLTNY